MFGVLGRPTSEPGSPTSGPDRRRTMALRWTYDERVEDGLVAGYGLRLCKQILEDPVGVGHCPRHVTDRDPDGRRHEGPAHSAGSP